MPRGTARPNDPSQPQPAPRILIVRIGAMGDILHAMPAVTALRAALPEAHIGWAVEPRWLPLLSSALQTQRDAEEQPLVDRIHLVPTRQWKTQPLSVATVRSIAALRRTLKAARYDLALDLQGSIRSAVIARLAGVPITLGPENPRERPARALYTHRATPQATHVVPQACELATAALNALGLAPQHSLQPLPPPLPYDPAAEIEATLDLGPEHLTERTALLAPTAGWGAKQWPAERFGVLAATLAAQGWQIGVNAATADDPVARKLCAAARTHGLTDDSRIRILPGSMAELIALTRRVQLVIGGDTGPVHLAAALGIPTVALFGPTDPARTGPWPADVHSPAVQTLRHPSSITDHRRHADTESGLSQITVEEVLAAMGKLFPTGDRTP